MKWFDHWFYNKARWCWHRANEQHPDWKMENDILDEVSKRINSVNRPPIQETRSGPFMPEVECGDPHDLTDGMRIDVKKLGGGWVVTFRTQNPADKNGNYVEPTKNSHIIREDQDFSNELCKLITLEQIRN
jgi:hypothetical protein